MAFDSFRHRGDPDRPNYRFFPNRTRRQTSILSWAILFGGSFVGVLMLQYSDRRQAELAAYYATLQKTGTLKAAEGQIQHQNTQLQEIFYRARRRMLGLPERPKQALEIPPEEEK